GEQLIQTGCSGSGIAGRSGGTGRPGVIHSQHRLRALPCIQRRLVRQPESLRAFVYLRRCSGSLSRRTRRVPERRQSEGAVNIASTEGERRWKPEILRNAALQDTCPQQEKDDPKARTHEFASASQVLPIAALVALRKVSRNTDKRDRASRSGRNSIAA